MHRRYQDLQDKKYQFISQEMHQRQAEIEKANSRIVKIQSLLQDLSSEVPEILKPNTTHILDFLTDNTQKLVEL
jgi:hypothetical protein